MEGRILAQRYQLVSQLGKGGMGSVWKALHLELGTPTAVKLISPEIMANPEALTRFKHEAQAAASLRSPHVVQILDYGVDGDTPYIAMELLEGESLADRLGRRGRLNLEETARIITQVARAVGKAHSVGIVHRDLKPDNIFIVENEDEEVAKVLDFGIAKTSGELGSPLQMNTGTGVMLGTPYYMSPEQAAGKRQIDQRTDTWALAVIAYQCVTGVRPFVSDTLGGIVLAICTEPAPRPSEHVATSQAFDQWFLHGVARDLDRRFQSARELAEELRAVAVGSATGQRPSFASVPQVVTAAGGPEETALPPATYASTTSRQAGPTSISVELPANKSKAPLALVFTLVVVLTVVGAFGYRWLGSSGSTSIAAASAPALSSPSGGAVTEPPPFRLELEHQPATHQPATPAESQPTVAPTAEASSAAEAESAPPRAAKRRPLKTSRPKSGSSASKAGAAEAAPRAATKTATSSRPAPTSGSRPAPKTEVKPPVDLAF